MSRRVTSAMALVALLALALAAVLADAARRRDLDRSRVDARRTLVRALGTADLCLSSSSRWLRHPSLSEPGAPFADVPASLDTDPAGALISAPRALYEGDGRPLSRAGGAP